MTRKYLGGNEESLASGHINEKLSRRRTLKGIGIGTTIGALGVGSVGTTAAENTTVTGGADELQIAIDNASSGDTITVEDSETYNPITIDLSDLTVAVAADETPTIDGDGVNEAVSIAADGVTFDGFNVTNNNGLLGIGVAAGTTGVTVSNNKVDGVGPTGNLGVTGIIAREPQNQLEITGNVITNLEQVITNNNLFTSTNGIFIDDVDDGGVSNVTIANNVVKNLFSEFGTVAILLNATASGGSITNNEISNVTADAPPGDEVGNPDYSPEAPVNFAQGINITSPTTENVEIAHNQITDIVSVDSFDPEAIKIDGDASGLACNRNDLVADIGVKNDDDDDTLSAECNWWGRDEGPNEADDNTASGGDGDERVGTVVGPVDYEPWLIDSIEENSPCTGGTPAVTNVSANPNPVAVEEETTLKATIDDSASGDSNIVSAEYSTDYGDTWKQMDAVDDAFDSPQEDVKATLGPYDTPEVLTVCVRGTDAEGGTSAPVCIDVAVYDPDGGFVTGGGWYNSSEGAYKEDNSVTGKATFGFVSKYQKGADEPKGNTQFQFHAADLDFKSDEYEWLVVSGNTARFKGSGSLKRDSDPYKFQVFATDDGPDGDAFRIKIVNESTDEVVYDNGSKTPIEGGNIKIHEG